MNFSEVLAKEFNLRQNYSDNIISLIDEGCTIPFIARYRKEMHGTCDDQVLRKFAERLDYLRRLQERKDEVKSSIESQEKWTDELARALEAAQTMTEVEDIYRPYKKKKKTRASVAIEQGLLPLAEILLSGIKEGNSVEIAMPFIDEEKGIATVKDAYNGAKDIVAEMISDDADLRKALRELLYGLGELSTELDSEKKDAQTYEMYKEYKEKLSAIPGHRILAINRGEKEDCLKVSVMLDQEVAIAKIGETYSKAGSIFETLLAEAISDSYARLIFPSISREIRTELFEKASEGAIKMFETNLKPLLMQPPLRNTVILGLDPAYRTGCKIAVIDASGNVLETGVVYPTPPQSKVEEATRLLKQMIERHAVDAIAIGNGTASKEAEIFVVNLIKAVNRPVSYMVVNEAGASVYSASELGAEEFPEFDVALRSAASIARRLQDPLAELIKIDVKSIGVGQYQHDMPQKRLAEVLSGVVEDCVNSVGVDLNTASYSLLSYVSGLNLSIAKNIVKYREKQKFSSRKELLKVSKLGPKAFEQSAGFLRLHDADEVLDNTGVHPESYAAAHALLKEFGYTEDDIRSNRLEGLKEKAERAGLVKLADKLGIGVPTLGDILDEIRKPGRDIRDSLPKPILRDDLLDLKDLKEGMEITGTVRNVIDFGAFVDIGVHQDGLVHISEISSRYIKHPSEVLTVGDVVTVKVLGVDAQKGRISLTLRGASVNAAQSESTVKDPQLKSRDGNKGNRSDFNKRDGKSSEVKKDVRTKSEPVASLEEMLAKLQKRFNR